MEKFNTFCVNDENPKKVPTEIAPHYTIRIIGYNHTNIHKFFVTREKKCAVRLPKLILRFN